MIEVRGFPSEGGALDVRIEAGEVVRLEGPNGSGKTSLLRALAGLDAPLAPASVSVGGADPRALHAKELPPLVSLATQDPRDALVGLTVEGEARLRRRALPAPLAPLAKRDVATLSSGEARRVALTLAGASDAPLLLLDEPLEGLDAEARAALDALVDAVRARGGAVVFADHAGPLVARATRVVSLGAPTPGPRLASIPPSTSAEVVLEAPAARVVREDRRIHLPPLALTAGFHALVGPNGAGKSTLLARLAGLDGEAAARIRGAPAAPGETVRLLPPRARDLLLGATVSEELREADAHVVAALVPDALLARHPLALSGGETQRVALALVLGRAAPCYLLDEPEAHLDAQGRAALVDVISRRVAEGACVLVATHDAAVIDCAHTLLRMGAAA